MSGKLVHRPKKEQRKLERDLKKREEEKKARQAEHKKANRERKFKLESPSTLYQHYGIPAAGDLREVTTKVIADFRYGNGIVDDGRIAQALFDPTVKRACDLAFGLFDRNDLAIPDDMVPYGPSIRTDLTSLCRRMIDRGEDQDLIDLIVARWPGHGETDEKLSHHVGRLVRLSIADEQLYRAIVSGRHGFVIRALLKDEVADSAREDVIALLVRHGLFWCAHDVQLALARNAFAETIRVENFTITNLKQVQPETFAEEYRTHWKYLEWIAKIEGLTGAAREAEKKRFLASMGRSKLGDFKRAVETDLRVGAYAAKVSSEDLDSHQAYIRSVLRKPPPRFRKILSQEKGASGLATNFHTEWFGLSKLQASAVTLLRYMQAEVELEQMVRSASSTPRVEARPHVDPLPKFRVAKLGSGWRSELKDLLFQYRLTLIENTDLDGAETWEGNAQDEVINKALKHLRLKTERKKGDHQDAQDWRNPNFTLIDVAPDRRLSNS